MSRRGNCYDNIVAENFFQLLKRERIRSKANVDREETRQGVYDHIGLYPLNVAMVTTRAKLR